eukprot:scaffold575763_cov42-Prasinocladus_malaysianus.AAC.1
MRGSCHASDTAFGPCVARSTQYLAVGTKPTMIILPHKSHPLTMTKNAKGCINRTMERKWRTKQRKRAGMN